MQQTITKERFVRHITKGKKENYLNVAIPTKLAQVLGYDQNTYVKMYIDLDNKLIFEKLEV